MDRDELARQEPSVAFSQHILNIRASRFLWRIILRIVNPEERDIVMVYCQRGCHMRW